MRDARRGNRYRPRTCIVCGAEYRPTGNAQQTCGRKCGAALARQKTPERGYMLGNEDRIRYHPDRGCELAPRCLACHLPQCKYDAPAAVRRTA